MTPVTDPATLAKLNGQTGLKPVSDPALLAKLNAQPTFMQTIAASPAGRLIHNFPVQTLEGLASLGTKLLVGPRYGNQAAGAVNAAAQKYIEDPYQAAIAAQRNRPGYAQALATAQAVQSRNGSGAQDQILAPFTSPLAGAAAMAVGGPGGRLNASNAAADVQQSAQQDYAQANPVKAFAAQLLGGLAMGKPTKLPPLTPPRPPAGTNVPNPGIMPQIISTRAGISGTPLSEGFKAGQTGGKAGEAFIANLRRRVPQESVIQQAKDAISALKMQRSAEYKTGMFNVGNDKTVLSFTPIDNALKDTQKISTFKGVDIRPQTAEARSAVKDLVNSWKKHPPADFHTAEGFDALKQQIGDLRDSYPYGSPARAVVDKVYNSVRQTIANQAPTYAKVMDKYSEASDLIDNIQKTLSVNPKASVDTLLRKLQSVMRDSVNTNYGQRVKLAAELDKASGKTLLPALAGQSLSSWVPRGLMRFAVGSEGIALPALALHNPGAAAALLATAPLQSPRVLGEGAYALGRMVGPSPALGIPNLRAAGTLPYGTLLPIGRMQTQ